jgi:glycosyltransferase involved in cell wall biosynthesis
MRLVDGFLFTAVEQAEPWRAAGLITAQQPVHAVPEASSALTPIQRQAARQMSRIAGNPAVLWVGRLNANKDPLTVLEGFEQSLARLPSLGLTMVFGEGDLIGDVQSRIQRSPTLGRHVSLAGRVPRHMMAAFYSAADLFVLGSHHEGSGYALIEALSCGAVPVVTNIPSFRTITGNGAVGALWLPGDASSCSEALIAAAQSDLEAARARVIEEFGRRLSWRAVGRQAMAAYADVLARRAVH